MDALGAAGAIASLGTLIAAIVALRMARDQIEIAKQSAALSAYENYHHFMLQYPDLSTGNFDYEAADGKERRRYAVFVLAMLLALERVMALLPKNPTWRAAFEDDLVAHKKFLCSAEFVPLIASINPIVAAFIADTATRLSWDYPANRSKRRPVTLTQPPRLP
jgi:hypothetical protein